MSILVVQLVREGLLFGADRNVTTSVEEDTVIFCGQAPRPKVLRWPNHKVVVGYMGRAEIGYDEPTDEWLYDFIGRNLDTDLPQIADNLKNDLESALRAEVGDDDDDYDHNDGIVVHLGGFVEDAGQWKPQVWYIRNTTIDSNYQDVKAKFDFSDEIPKYFPGKTGNRIRADVADLADAWKPFWFHQGIDLGTFNTLDQVLRHGMRAIVETHPDPPHQFPESLREWSKHFKMAILSYGAYFGAFYEPYEQYVGGGADVVWAEWPPVAPMK